MVPKLRMGRARHGYRVARQGWLAAALAVAMMGCASAPVIPPPIVSKASLGAVVIYRNGVAFFERSLAPGETELKLRVPEERVDDFLKSLTIIDDETGETMPVSYPTVKRNGGDVEMTIELPPAHHGLRITYVTESPAWKPTYRIALDERGKAKLQAWAVVDNVSGEDWKNVRVGVGSTSALSFRYDLHSVRVVERETLSSGSLMAVAPPTGGSPYRTKPRGERELLAVSQSAAQQLALQPPRDKRGASEVKGATLRGGGGKLARVPDSRTGAFRPPPPAPPSTSDQAAPAVQTRGGEASRTVSVLTRKLQNRNRRIRIEGYASTKDDRPGRASLARANRLRDELIANGVKPEQVEAVGTGAIDEARGLRVVQLAEPAGPGPEAEPKPTDGDTSDAQPLGQAHFLSKQALTIARDHSAMISIFHGDADAEEVYFYDPISVRGSKDFAFRAVRIKNPSDYTLDGGPFTVYTDDQFLGEGLSGQILPGGTAFIPFALDRSVIVEPEVDEREEIARLVSIQRGIVATESKKIRRTQLHLVNRGTARSTVYIRHKVLPGYELRTLGPKAPPPEKLDGAHLFRVEAPPGKRTTLVLEEWTPVKRTVDIRDDNGVRQMALYLKHANLPGELKKGLDEVVQRHLSRADLLEKITTLEEQMAVYRERVDELNLQLLTLKKVRTAAKLRRHLADKMEEISDALQSSTIELADLRAQLMTQRIELQDKLAELTLREPRADEVASK